MKLGCGLPMGPLALLDLIGLDTAYEILDTMYKQCRDRLHAPQPIFKQMMTAGLLGRKTGRGFYTYDAPDSPNVVADALDPGARTRIVGGARPVSKVGVVGSGTMATGIVEVFAKAGYDVTFVARSDGEGREGRRRPSPARWTRRSQRGKLDRGPTATPPLARITGTTSLDDLADVAAGRRGRRRGPRGQADAVRQPRRHLRAGHRARHHDVLACRSSSARRPPRGPADVIGMHFFNPAAIMQLVEVVTTVSTAADVEATVLDVTREDRQAPGALRRPAPASSSTRCCSRTSTTRSRCSRRTTRRADDIDSAMKVGCGYPMGPFELLDVVGNDVSLAIERELYLEFREPGFAPAPLLEHLVTAGRLGRKTGKGFRDYG